MHRQLRSTLVFRRVRGILGDGVQILSGRGSSTLSARPPLFVTHFDPQVRKALSIPNSPTSVNTCRALCSASQRGSRYRYNKGRSQNKPTYSPFSGVYEQNIIVVDSLETLALARRLLLDPSHTETHCNFEDPVGQAQQVGPVVLNPVGLDCEWQPFNKKQAATAVSVLQVVTRRHAFLVDMLYWCRPLGVSDEHSDERPIASTTQPGPPTEWLSRIQQRSAQVVDFDGVTLTPREQQINEFIQDLFSSDHLALAGFRFGYDLYRLQTSYPHLPVMQTSAPAGPGNAGRVADVLQMAQKLVSKRMTGYMPLKNLVKIVLNCQLDKSEQCSSWGERPLTKQQMLYAAADGHTVVAIIDRLISMHGMSAVRSLANCPTRNYRPPGRSSTSTSTSSTPSTSWLCLPGQAGLRSMPEGQSRRKFKKCDTSFVHVDVDQLIQSQLGKSPSGGNGGQAAVIKSVAANQRVTFNRHSAGVVEWGNMFMVLATTSSTSRTISMSPSWLQQGKSIQWSSESGGNQQVALIKDLLKLHFILRNTNNHSVDENEPSRTNSVGQGAAYVDDIADGTRTSCSSKVQDHQHPVQTMKPVVLWVRNPHTPYICCGRITPEVDSLQEMMSNEGLRWSLESFKALKNNSIFRTIVGVQVHQQL